MRLYLQTFGCRANHYDSETVRALAVAGGYEVVDDVREADVALFNSCAVTSAAERDLRKAVRRAARSRPELRSIVMGCAAALETSRPVLRSLPAVQEVIGGADLGRIASALGVAHDATIARQSTVRAVLRIQDGCDEHCTFCATTLARGASRSRTMDALVEEARQLAERHPEIVLTGTHIGTYGADVGLSLGELMERLVHDVPDARFRLSSVEATEVDERLADLFASVPRRLVPHLHAPLQSGSNRLLRRMGRHWYTPDSYARAVERLASRLPVLGLGADVIVGFPGETDADFEATVRLVERLPFTYLHVFTYSPRPGTAATRLPDAVEPAVAQERSEQLRSLADQKASHYRARRHGTRADAIVITSGPDREAITEDYLTVATAESRPRGERFDTTLMLRSDEMIAA